MMQRLYYGDGSGSWIELNTDDDRVTSIRAVRMATGCGLRAGIDFVDAFRRGLSAEEVQERFAELGRPAGPSDGELLKWFAEQLGVTTTEVEQAYLGRSTLTVKMQAPTLMVVATGD